MNNKILAGAVIALIVLAAGIYFVYKNRQASNAPNAITASNPSQAPTSAYQGSGGKYGGLSSDLVTSAQQTDNVPSGEANIPP